MINNTIMCTVNRQRKYKVCIILRVILQLMHSKNIFSKQGDRIIIQEPSNQKMIKEKLNQTREQISVM